MFGKLIAFYQVGFGLAALGVGPLQDATGIPLSAAYTLASAVAAAAATVLAVLIIRPGDRADPKK